MGGCEVTAVVLGGVVTVDVGGPETGGFVSPRMGVEVCEPLSFPRLRSATPAAPASARPAAAIPPLPLGSFDRAFLTPLGSGWRRWSQPPATPRRAVEPRRAYPRILGSRMIGLSTEPVDADDVWFVSCFVVRVGHRRSGVAGALLAGAIEHARRHGARVLEAFPVETLPGTSSADLYHGPLSAFERAGFEVVARPSEARAVVRLAL